MQYHLAPPSELSEILTLRCCSGKVLNLGLALNGIGLGSTDTWPLSFINYNVTKYSVIDNAEKQRSLEPERLIAEFIPDLDLASLQLILQHPILGKLLQRERLLNQFQIPNSDHVLKTLDRSIEWSNAVLNWLTQKNIKPQEISFLNLLSNVQSSDLLAKASQSSLSKMDSLKTLELASELILMNKDKGSLFEAPWTDKTYEQLNSLRNPLSHKNNPIQTLQLKWPKSVTIQTKRVHDKMGFQIQFFSSHPEELRRTLEQLETIVPRWSESLEELNQ